MVYVNSKKFACESCIKGHRSSNCHHNDRPLFEIKKKGRPVSQCERCREARQARRIHAKCTCDLDKAGNLIAVAGPSTSKKGKRFIPTVPTLPNGLKDAWKAPDASTSAELNVPRAQVDALLNPCHCKDVWSCRCGSQKEARANKNVSLASTSELPTFSSGLSALAHAASCCTPAAPVTLPPLSQRLPQSVSQTLSSESRGPHFSDRGLSYESSGGSNRQLGKSTRSIKPFSSFSVPSETYRPPPNFPNATFASSSRVEASNDSCCCGHRCECEGCSLHDGPQSSGSVPNPTNLAVNHKKNDHCGQDCSTCVDHDGGVELPPQPGQSNPASTTFLDKFFARAAALPSPPPQVGGRSTSLDPTNVTMYPPSLFSRAGSSQDEQRGLAFGLVNVPKLECCGGKCSCPEDKCACGTECGGCCD